MTVAVNDANILIDVYELGLLEELFSLSVHFCVVQQVWDELHECQRKAYLPFVETGKLLVGGLSDEGFDEVLAVKRLKPQLSIPDCCAMVYAEQRNAVLVTGDKNLRMTAKKHGVIVRGHLWIFDMLVEEKIIASAAAVGLLQRLTDEVNPRLGLPRADCANAVLRWQATE